MSQTTINLIVGGGLLLAVWYLSEQNTTLIILVFAAMAYLLFANGLVKV